jgi:hypothetical protein
MNARDELLSLLNDREEIVCAYLNYNGFEKILKANHSESELTRFLNSLSFEYDHGYGIQEIEGTVWLKNNIWLERREYDGAEWWERKECPEIPDLLTTKTINNDKTK